MGDITLCTDFKEAQAALKLAQPQIMPPSVTLPVLDVKPWNAERDRYNCYRFAMDVQKDLFEEADKLQPGYLVIMRQLLRSSIGVGDSWGEYYKIRMSLWDDPDMSSYAAAIVEQVKKDGLIPLGFDFSLKAGGFPMALFVSSKERTIANDYHWYALRCDEAGRLLWACKYPTDVVKVFDDSSMIFEDARNNSYQHFAGYFFRPYNLEY